MALSWWNVGKTPLACKVASWIPTLDNTVLICHIFRPPIINMRLLAVKLTLIVFVAYWPKRVKTILFLLLSRYNTIHINNLVYAFSILLKSIKWKSPLTKAMLGRRTIDPFDDDHGIWKIVTWNLTWVKSKDRKLQKSSSSF